AGYSQGSSLIWQARQPASTSEAVAVSAAAPGRPWRAVPLRLVSRAWRGLRRMRTAIALLAILGMLAIIGTLLPQIPQNPRGVMGYVLNHPTTAPWFARLGLFDIFSSWLFVITAVLLYTSIGASLVVRIPAAWRRGRETAQRNRAWWAEVASIIFHGSFFILLVGVLYGKAAALVVNAWFVGERLFGASRDYALVYG